MTDKELKCSVCKSTDIETRCVNEVCVAGIDMAVGPYDIHECENCGYEWVDHS